MKNKLFGLLLIAVIAITNGALAQRPAAEPGVMGKIKEMFVGPSKPRDAKMADMRSPKLSGTERWTQVRTCLIESGVKEDAWIMRWANKNLRRAEHWSGLSPAQRKAVRRKKREARAAMGEPVTMRAPRKAHKRMKTRAERMAKARARRTAAERAAETPRR